VQQQDRGALAVVIQSDRDVCESDFGSHGLFAGPCLLERGASRTGERPAQQCTLAQITRGRES
jgi:hypothetical protein